MSPRQLFSTKFKKALKNFKVCYMTKCFMTFTCSIRLKSFFIKFPHDTKAKKLNVYALSLHSIPRETFL